MNYPRGMTTDQMEAEARVKGGKKFYTFDDIKGEFSKDQQDEIARYSEEVSKGGFFRPVPGSAPDLALSRLDILNGNTDRFKDIEQERREVHKFIKEKLSKSYPHKSLAKIFGLEYRDVLLHADAMVGLPYNVISQTEAHLRIAQTLVASEFARLNKIMWELHYGMPKE